MMRSVWIHRPPVRPESSARISLWRFLSRVSPRAMRWPDMAGRREGLLFERISEGEKRLKPLEFRRDGRGGIFGSGMRISMKRGQVTSEGIFSATHRQSLATDETASSSHLTVMERSHAHSRASNREKSQWLVHRPVTDCGTDFF